MSLVSRRTQVRSTLFLVILSLSTFTAQAQVVISQVYGGGGNTGAPLKNDYVELFNRGTSPVSVTGWSVQYASSAGTTWQRTNLTGTINPGQYYLVQQAQGANTALPFPTADAVGTIAMAAGAGKVALVNNQVTLTGSCPTGLVDFVGFGSAANCFEGSGPTGTLANTTAALRAGQGCTDSNNNSADFSVGGPAPRNTSSPMFTCAGPTLPTGVGAASPNALVPGGSTQLTVAVTPGQNPTSMGLQVSADLSAIGGNATQTFFDDGVSGGDTTAGDKVFSYLVTVSVATLPGAKSLPIALTDAQSRTNGTTIAITVQEPPPPAIAINQIQGTGSLSPYSGQKVSTTGIVTARRSNGFFLQTPDGAVDGDSSTSEGIFVFTSSAPTSTATIGNEVQVTGTVVEFKPTGSSADPFAFPLTELSGTPTVTLLTTGNSLPVPVVLTAVHTSPTGSLEQLERFEAMRVYVASLTTTSPTGGFKSEANATSTTDGTFYAVITGVDRPFREAGIEEPEPLPAGAPAGVPRFDGNPERLRVDSDGQAGATALNVTSNTLLMDVVGVLDHANRSYTILPDASSAPIVAGSMAVVPVGAASNDELTVASFNMERFFDTVNDTGVSDVALSATAFNNRLNKASLTIRNVLGTPDIIGVEEMENLSTLQALAGRINSDAVAAGGVDPQYQAYLEEGNDPGGIDVGFLVKSSRVTVNSVMQFGLDEQFVDPSDGSLDLLNDRPPLVLNATVSRQNAPNLVLSVIVNHMRSLNDVETLPRVRAKRRAQAEYLANLIQAAQSADPNANIVSVGDYNAFGFNDGYVDVMGTIMGAPTPVDEVTLASVDLVDPNLVDLATT
ncbi:MAG TPA: lamin tail domain-containing protein, partial [Terriglobales bacterium]|nr:lamin tail domain-containing protein [Terriglobales bacterium]